MAGALFAQACSDTTHRSVPDVLPAEGPFLLPTAAPNGQQAPAERVDLFPYGAHDRRNDVDEVVRFRSYRSLGMAPAGRDAMKAEEIPPS